MKSIVAVFSVSLLTVAIASPAGVYVGPNGEVGASWGGYSASAGLGGLVSGGKVGTRGGLHAEAGTPDGYFAAAGLGGSVSEGGQEGGLYSVAGTSGVKPVVKPVIVSGGSGSQASASASATSSASAGSNAGSNSGTNVNHVHYVIHNKRPSGQGTFFDDIFNIPISVLGAVNKFLNNKNGAHVHGTTVVSSVSTANNNQVHQPVVKPVVASQSQASSSASATATASASSSANAGSSSNAGSGSNAVAGSGTVVAGSIDNNIYHGHVHHKHHVHHGGNFDDIFNIPISVLGAVNRLLNNGKK